MPSTFLLVSVIVLALAFDYINGFHDTANSIATTVLTGALSVPKAILLAATLNFAGALMSKGVATTIGKGIVDPKVVSLEVILAALMAAIVWNLLTWWWGLPSSSSHALIGGIIGAVFAANGFGNFEVAGLKKIGTALVLSPVVGLFGGYFLMVSIMWIFRNFSPSKINRFFKLFQVVSASSMALSHGENDAQKTMGVITMALASGGYIDAFHIPFWVMLACASAMALGTAAGGWRIIKTVGRKVMVLQPVHGFAAETAGAATIFAATAFGAPISTTHVISSSIMGVGMVRSLSGVRWTIVQQIVSAWVMTLPVTALIAALMVLVIKIF